MLGYRMVFGHDERHTTHCLNTDIDQQLGLFRKYIVGRREEIDTQPSTGIVSATSRADCLRILPEVQL